MHFLDTVVKIKDSSLIELLLDAENRGHFSIEEKEVLEKRVEGKTGSRLMSFLLNGDDVHGVTHLISALDLRKE